MEGSEVSDWRLPAAVVFLTLFGWALVAATESRFEALEPEVVTKVRTVTVEVAAPPVETPVADSFIDWVEVERQEQCLWEFIQLTGFELTLEMVWAAGEVADALGGACYLIGEDDE